MRVQLLISFLFLSIMASGAERLAPDSSLERKLSAFLPTADWSPARLKVVKTLTASVAAGTKEDCFNISEPLGKDTPLSPITTFKTYLRNGPTDENLRKITTSRWREERTSRDQKWREQEKLLHEKLLQEARVCVNDWIWLNSAHVIAKVTFYDREDNPIVRGTTFAFRKSDSAWLLDSLPEDPFLIAALAHASDLSLPAVEIETPLADSSLLTKKSKVPFRAAGVEKADTEERLPGKRFSISQDLQVKYWQATGDELNIAMISGLAVARLAPDKPVVLFALREAQSEEGLIRRVIVASPSVLFSPDPKLHFEVRP